MLIFLFFPLRGLRGANFVFWWFSHVPSNVKSIFLNIKGSGLMGNILFFLIICPVY